jgi:uncharacterized membrane protein YedE/YeeE
MIIENFTPWSAFIGGILIGSAAVLLLGLNGRIAGVSGILGGVVSDPVSGLGESAWRLAFLLGLILGAQAVALIQPVALEIAASWPALIVGGLLVGFGTRLGNGCTSGHGVCGIARLSPRSLVATGIFVLTAMITLFVVRHLIGLQP